MEATKIIHSFDARECSAFGQDGMILDKHYNKNDMAKVLKAVGIGFDGFSAQQVGQVFAMDTFPTVQANLTTASIPALLQNLQNWLPGMVKILTAARMIDDIVGIQTTGDWEDEEIVQTLLENTGTATIYGDLTNPVMDNWNLVYNTRTNVRFESGMRVGVLEEKRAAKQRVNSGQEKRESAALELEIIRNAVGFYGYNSGNNNTYGFLNDPALPAYVEVASNGAGGYAWSTKTMLQICADIRTAFQQLRTNSQDTIKPGKTKICLVIATSSVDYLSTQSDFGLSVWGWLKETYGDTVRVESAPQLNNASNGDNVFYAFAEEVADTSTDDRKTFIQVVSQKFFVVGVQKLAKGYEEDYSNCTAGIMCKRPYAVVRYYNC